MLPELDPARCGTNAQARAHYRRGQKPCNACAQAAARYTQDRLRKNKP